MLTSVRNVKFFINTMFITAVCVISFVSFAAFPLIVLYLELLNLVSLVQTGGLSSTRIFSAGFQVPIMAAN